jgi:signal transduction histidine kinase
MMPEKPDENSIDLAIENITSDYSELAAEKYQFLGYHFSSYEVGLLWFFACSFLAAYIVCFIAGIKYASLTHSHILYAVFVLLNVTAAAISFMAWTKIPSRSIARDSSLFLNFSLCSAALGNLIDFLFWVFQIAPFKQSVFTNLFFVFAILFALPGIHLLGKVCRVEFNRQSWLYYLALIATSVAIPFLMNPGSINSGEFSANPKEVVFGLLYSIGIGYLAATGYFLWRNAQGRLFHSARFISMGCIMLSLGCSIYAGLFIGIPIEEIPSHPVHIVLALGYLCVALGLRHTGIVINSIFNLKESLLPPSLPLIEIFGPSQGMAVYRKMESSIKNALEELLRSKAESEMKQRIIGELEAEVKLRKETEKALILEKEKAEEANKTKSQFLAMMSHELKTPLTAIKGYGQILSSTSGPASTLPAQKIQEIAGHIVLNSNHLQNMIDGILRFSQLENGSFTYHVEEFRLADILDQIDSLLLPQLSNLTGFVTNVPERDLILKTDRLSLQHIILNLLTNALKFGKDGKISLEIRRSGRDLFIVVEDSGIGIAPQHLENIFEAFYQISHGNRRKYGGTGLGLSIVKKLTEELKGKIFVNSEPDKGSRFEILLPEVIIEGNQHES